MPTTATNIMGFNFDIVFDPTNLSVVFGSANAGSFLTADGASVLIAATMSPTEPGHLVVGVRRTGTSNGIQGVAPHDVVLQFELKADPFIPFGPSLMTFEHAEAVDADGNAIPSISFSDQLLISIE